MNNWIYCALFYLLFLCAVESDDMCITYLPLDQSSFTASSFTKNHKPADALLLKNESTSTVKAWCPNNLNAASSSEYLQVDLGGMFLIRTIFTVGLNKGSSEPAFMRYFKINYTRNDEPDNWMIYRDKNNKTVFNANADHMYFNLKVLDPGMIARHVRIIPYISKGYSEKVCMRIKMYECPFENHLLSYEAPKVNHKEEYKQYYDSTYDNPQERSPVYSGGLGQLTDMKTNTAVGWSRDSMNNDDHIDITFQFTNLRKFKEVRFLTDNNYNKNIRIFHKVEIHSSRAGQYYDEKPSIVETVVRDTRTFAARSIRVDLKDRVAQYLRVRLFFDDEWIVLNEVVFESEKYEGPPLKPENIPMKTTDRSDFSNSSQKGQFYISTTVYSLIAIAVFLFILIVVAALLLCLYFKRKQNRKKKQLSMNNNQLQSQPAHKTKSYSGLIQIDLSQTHPMSVNGKVVHSDAIYTSLPGSDTESNMSPEYASASLGANTQLYPYMPPPSYSTQPTPLMGHQAPLPVVSNAQIINNPMADMMERYRTFIDPNVRTLAPQTMTTGTPRMTHPTLPKLPVDQFAVSQITNSLMNLQAGAGNSLYLSLAEMEQQNKSIEDLDLDHIDQQQLFFLEILGMGSWGEIHLAELQQLPSNPASSVNENKNTRSRTDSGINGANVGTGTTSGGSDLEEEEPDHSSQADLVTAGLVASCKSSGRTVKHSNTTKSHKEATSLPIGGYPTTHAMTISTNGVMSDRLMSSSSPANTVNSLVAVKMLRKDAQDRVRENFFMELRILSRLKNPNLAALVGVYEDESHMCLITEYQQYGDLHQFLQTHYSTDLCNNMQPLPPNTRTLSYAAQIYMSVQVASACKYLESLQIVHRDIACRNCLVGPSYTIKVSDIGASRRHYSTDYFRPELNVLLPIRWMAWESILQGRFSGKSDVWSFAVTLWEILTLCREQPFQLLTDSQIIQQANLWAAGDNRAHRLPKPYTCPKETWDLMVECWSREEHKRPTFREIHMFLQRLNQGYDPREEPPVAVNIAGTLANPLFTIQNRSKPSFQSHQSPAAGCTTSGLTTSC